jgi:hypothetical protein
VATSIIVFANNTARSSWVLGGNSTERYITTNKPNQNNPKFNIGVFVATSVLIVFWFMRTRLHINFEVGLLLHFMFIWSKFMYGLMMAR